MTKIQILTYLQNNGGTVSYIDFLNHSKKHKCYRKSQIDDKMRLQSLIDSKAIKGSTKSDSSLHITSVGISMLDVHKEEKSARRSQIAHDWLIVLASALLGAFLSEPFWQFLSCLFNIKA